MSITKSFIIKIINHFTESNKYNFENIDWFAYRDKGFLSRSGYSGINDIIAVDTEGLVIGCLSLWISDSDKMVTLSYIEVDKQHQQQGVAKELIQAMVMYLKQTYPSYALHRTAPSNTCPHHFTHSVSCILNEYQIRWVQKNEFDDYFTSPNWTTPTSS